MEHDDNTCIRTVATRLPCTINPNCTSSDGMVINSDGSMKCFACGTYVKGHALDITKIPIQEKREAQGFSNIMYPKSLRSIVKETFIKYNSGFGQTRNEVDKDKMVFNYGSRAQKIRKISDKKQWWSGVSRASRGSRLFGKELFCGEDVLYITEGEYDAMTVHQITGAAAVSVSGGVGSALRDIRGNIDYIKTFGRIVIFFDNDEVGIQAGKRAYTYLNSKLCNVAWFKHHPDFKDANEYLTKGQEHLILEQHLTIKRMRLEDAEAYYCSSTDRYIFRDTDGTFSTGNKSMMIATLKDVCGTTDVQQINEHIESLKSARNPRFVHCTARYPYFKPIVHTQYDGTRVLNTANMQVLEPREGTAPIIMQLLQEMFGHEQLPYIIGWLSNFVKECYNLSPRQGPAVYLAGDSGAGKGLLQDVILSAIVGRAGDGKQILKGDYNSLAFECPYISVSDMPASPNDRLTLTAKVKEVVANTNHSSNAKFGALTHIKWSGRFLVSLNSDEYSENMLPVIEASDWEKFMLFKITKGETIVRYTSHEWSGIIDREAPELCWILLNHELPEELKDSRFGIKAFHNKDILATIKSDDPLMPFVRLLENYLASLRTTSITASVDALFRGCLEYEARFPVQCRVLHHQIRLVHFNSKIKRVEKKVSWIKRISDEEYTITKKVDF